MQTPVNDTTETTATDPNVPTTEELINTQSVVADKILKSEMGWKVLDQLWLQLCRQMLATKNFVVPTMNRIDELRERLNDSDGFEKSFSTLMGDLKYMQDRLKILRERHEGKSGRPTPEEWPVLYAIATEYQDAMVYYDTAIHPLMMDLIDTIKHDHPEMVDMSATG